MTQLCGAGSCRVHVLETGCQDWIGSSPMVWCMPGSWTSSFCLKIKTRALEPGFWQYRLQNSRNTISGISSFFVQQTSQNSTPNGIFGPGRMMPRGWNFTSLSWPHMNRKGRVPEHHRARKDVAAPVSSTFRSNRRASRPPGSSRHLAGRNHAVTAPPAGV